MSTGNPDNIISLSNFSNSPITIDWSQSGTAINANTLIGSGVATHLTIEKVSDPINNSIFRHDTGASMTEYSNGLVIDSDNPNDLLYRVSNVYIPDRFLISVDKNALTDYPIQINTKKETFYGIWVACSKQYYDPGTMCGIYDLLLKGVTALQFAELVNIGKKKYRK